MKGPDRSTLTLFFRRALAGELGTSRKSQTVLMGAAFLIILFDLLAKTIPTDGFRGPPKSGDGPDYDNIAVNLVQGRGFGYDWDDSEWRRPYVRENNDGRYDGLLARSGEFYPTTYRPPAFPFAIAAIYRTCGRRFAAVRAVNAIWIAGGVALAVGLAARMGGAIPAILTLAIASRHSTVRTYVSDLLTEPMALFLLTVVVWLLMLTQQRPRFSTAIAAGAGFGLLILARSIFVLWIPCLLVLLLAFAVHSRRSDQAVRPVAVLSAFLIGVLMLLSPWWVRNCLVLDTLMPFGTQGPISLVGGYCDEAYRSGGNWSSKPALAIQRELSRQSWLGGIDEETIREREFARACQSRLLNWIQNNPRKLPIIAWKRLVTHWNPYSGKSLMFKLAALAGVLFVWRHPLGIIMIVLLGIDALCVMATYATGGRFLMPLYPVLYVLAALGTWGLVAWVVEKLWPRRTRHRKLSQWFCPTKNS